MQFVRSFGAFALVSLSLPAATFASPLAAKSGSLIDVSLSNITDATSNVFASTVGEPAAHGKVTEGGLAVKHVSNHDGSGGGPDRYIQYGCGSGSHAFPHMSSWVSFDSMWAHNSKVMKNSCNGVRDDSPAEIDAIYDAIQQVAKETYVDHRFILAVIMQESTGCVRVKTTNGGVRNPGLMQDHNGRSTCNEGGRVQTPCPRATILGMIREGTAGTAGASGGEGLAQVINRAVKEGASGSKAFYRAARLYNSGSVHPSGCLEKGIATHCYASDIANRLTGWVSAPSHCTFDG